MYTGTYLIAGHCFRLDSRHPEIHRLAEAFRTTRPVEEWIESPEWMPRWLREQYCPGVDRIPIGPNTEVFSMLTAVMAALEPRGYLAIHGCAFAVDGTGILLVAGSGVGKTTHALHWQTLLGDRFRFINGDIPFLKKERGRVYAYGTPWNGKERLGGTDRACLRAIVHLTRGEENRLEPVSLPLSRSWLRDAALLTGHLDGYPGRDLGRMEHNLEQVVAGLPLFELHCTPDPDAARVALEGLSTILKIQ